MEEFIEAFNDIYYTDTKTLYEMLKKINPKSLVINWLNDIDNNEETFRPDRAKELLCHYYYDKRDSLEPDEFKTFANSVYDLIGNSFVHMISDYLHLAAEYYASQGQPYLIYQKVLIYDRQYLNTYYLENFTRDLTAKQMLELVTSVINENENSCYVVISTKGLRKALNELLALPGR